MWAWLHKFKFSHFNAPEIASLIKHFVTSHFGIFAHLKSKVTIAFIRLVVSNTKFTMFENTVEIRFVAIATMQCNEKVFPFAETCFCIHLQSNQLLCFVGTLLVRHERKWQTSHGHYAGQALIGSEH